MLKNLSKIIALLLVASCISCAKKKKDPTVEIDYLKAYEMLKDKDFSESAKAFEKIEDDYPFSKWAAKSQIMAAYAYFKNEDYEDVNRVVEDFIRINPNDERIDYMIYLKGVSYFEQIPQITRAQDPTKQASMIFRELKARFPQSKYSEDARVKLVIIDEHLAGQKMSVGRYEMKNANYVGAIKNFNEVVWRYKRTQQAAEGYYRLFEIYTKLGIEDEAQTVYDELAMNFLQSKWLEKAQKLKEKF